MQMGNDRLETIIAGGSAATGEHAWRADPIVCADGFEISVQASWAHYCSPRPNYPKEYGGAEKDYAGPFTHVECGFPSAVPQPWKLGWFLGFFYWLHVFLWGKLKVWKWEPKNRALFEKIVREPNRLHLWTYYTEGLNDDPLETVYPYVPVDMVRDLIDLHGGEVDAE